MGKKASEKVVYYENQNGPLIGVISKGVIEQDGLYFKDINGDGKLSVYKDWRCTPKERAQSLAKELSVEEKIGLLFINSWKMGMCQEDKSAVDETGLLDEKIVEKEESIFNAEKTYGTTYTIKEQGIRHMILRSNPKPEELADWINELNRVAEECGHAIPVLVVSNSRNENGELVFGMNDAAGTFATWPGTLGIAAAIKGDSIEIIDEFADCIRKEWNAVGMKKGYMYMADVVTDPRWQRTYGTFGEDGALISDIFDHLVPRVQGSTEGVTTEGVAMTVKHFPGGGARENGFDPHYRQGQWNVYQTEDSLRKYHLPAFETAIKNHACSIMPYYAKPAKEKSAPQFDKNGNPVPMKPVGFAFNQFFLQDLLKEQMGFDGYINSDSGITNKMAWGVEDLDIPERIALAVHTGVDLISGSLDVESAKEAYQRGQNGYYTTQGHKVPEGYTIEEITLNDEVLTKAVERTLAEQFALGVFDNPYRKPEEAKRIVDEKSDWECAYDVHKKSVVLLKNENSTLPLTKDKLEGKKVYVEAFFQSQEEADKQTESLRKMFAEENVSLTENHEEADYLVFFVSPKSGAYFNATKGYLELDICDGKQVVDVDDEGCPTDTTHEETTVAGINRMQEMAKQANNRGAKVISNVNITLAWIMGNVESCSDVLLAGFDTYPAATIEVILGKFAPVGKLPLTLPKDDSVLKVNEQGVCVSPNDVPGYDKDKYMPEEMKDENGKAYAYRDSAGNYYEMNFGLSF